MSENDFWKGVQEKAYYNYINRINNNIPGSEYQDWTGAEREQRIEEKIREEAYLHYLGNGNNSLQNWINAKNEIMYRLQFLAFYLHESNMKKSALENWIDAEDLYLSKFS